ncbi:thiamine-binding protein [Synechococcus sp. A15-127]|jgi:uncharacterized protein (TIGR00106 family)|uniref:MTH1187 family thiamine-binding protein n=1 Tax=Synechococcus sp. A15-127 TaxID=1050624 RepID=UPI00003393DC|nr:MTH1187 family thiamine-binding protein [Synechococcus sp. A15-127]QNI95065.1 thiamine-binding protein [Synechococcus sp. A15-127]
MNWVSIDLCVVPIGVGVSLSPYIAACQRVIEAAGLEHELGANGTAIEGPWDEVMACVRACHDELHRLGVPRVYTTLKLNTRADRHQSFREKVEAVKREQTS